jgi:hypothetical protein
MSDVYQNARLTIAASHATDTSQPCFFARPPQPFAVELPHISRNGETDGSIYATLSPADYADICPDSGPLANRAWATQEWLLSRRMIFYTAGSLVWSCKAITQWETGASFHSTARNPRWKIIVEKYSARLLTHQSDRLIALDGVKTALSAKRPTDTYCFGLWKNNMPDQLLWYCLKPAERIKSELDLPTWTWASSLHGVRFVTLKGAKNACEGFRFDEPSKTLCIRSVTKEISKIDKLTAGSRGRWYTEHIPFGVAAASLQHVLWGDDGQHIGVAVLDEETVPSGKLCCLRLMRKATRPQPSPFIPDERPAVRYEELVLILRQKDDSDHIYERVGVGVLETATPWFEDLSPMSYDIR